MNQVQKNLSYTHCHKDCLHIMTSFAKNNPIVNTQGEHSHLYTQLLIKILKSMKSWYLYKIAMWGHTFKFGGGSNQGRGY